MQLQVYVVHTIKIEVDKSKFTEEWMEEFRASFYPFYAIDEHIEHIAQLQARGIIDLEFKPNTFIEGYGPATDMGIKLVSAEVEIDGSEYV